MSVQKKNEINFIIIVLQLVSWPTKYCVRVAVFCVFICKTNRSTSVYVYCILYVISRPPGYNISGFVIIYYNVNCSYSLIEHLFNIYTYLYYIGIPINTYFVSNFYWLRHKSSIFIMIYILYK